MKIINNKIYIVQGETPTYIADVIDKDSGAPLIIDPGKENPTIVFIVRPSIYAREHNYVMKEHFLYDGKRFSRIEDYKAFDYWNNDYAGEEGVLYRKGLEYKYYDTDSNEWKDYSFTINFTFPYSATSKMEPKTYKYEITLFCGTENLENDIGINIDYKKPLLEATDFIVGGSLSE